MRQFFSVIFNYLNGNFAYENYLKHAQKNHPEKEVLSKKKFLQERVRGKKINRCC
ncbi:MAG: YbdD/YjiX family protein [Rickettsiales bacterium]|nr:YbdD/YjiX family protein [Rickettsiales bacterium]